MLTRKKTKNVTILHSGETFTSCEAFQPGILPTKRQVLERILNWNNFITKEAAKSVANGLFDRWVWSNVYPLRLLTIIQKVDSLVTKLSTLDRWPKKRRNVNFLEREPRFLQDIDKIFDIFCLDKHQRLCLERQYNLWISDRDYEYYEDQKEDRKTRCLEEIVPLSDSDKAFVRRTSRTSSTSGAKSIQLPSFFKSLTAAELEEASSEPKSIASSSSQFLPLAHSSSQSEQNCNSGPNLFRMCEHYQLPHKAGAAIASSVLQDLGLVNEENRSMIIDYNKLRRERQKCREEIRKQEKENFSLVNGLYLDGRKDATQVLLQGSNGKLYQLVQLEEHYTLVREPGTYYLTHLSPENGTGRAIAEDFLRLLRLSGQCSIMIK